VFSRRPQAGGDSAFDVEFGTNAKEACLGVTETIVVGPGKNLAGVSQPGVVIHTSSTEIGLYEYRYRSP